MSARQPLGREVIAQIAQRLRVVADPNRIALLEALGSEEASVQELSDQIDLPHQNASHHLALLWREGILTRRTEGRTTLYAVEDWTAWWVIEELARSLQARP